MNDKLKQAVELCTQLSYEEVEALKSVLFDINYQRKKQIEEAINTIINHV